MLAYYLIMAQIRRNMLETYYKPPSFTRSIVDGTTGTTSATDFYHYNAMVLNSISIMRTVFIVRLIRRLLLNSSIATETFDELQAGLLKS